MRATFQAYKPIFYVISDLIKDYQELLVDERRMLITAQNIITNRFDGIVLTDNDTDVHNKSIEEIVRSLIKAIHITEGTYSADKEYYKLSFKVLVCFYTLMV